MIDSIGPRKTGPILKIKRAASEDEDAKKPKRGRHDDTEESPDSTHKEGRKGVRIDDHV